MVEDLALVSSFSAETLSFDAVIKSMQGVLDDAAASGNCHFILSKFVEGGQDQRLLYSTSKLDIYDVEELQLPQEALNKGYLGFGDVKGKRYFHATNSFEINGRECCLFTLVPVDFVYAGRMEDTLISFLLILVIMLVMLAVMLLYGENRYNALLDEAEAEIEARKAMTQIQLERMDVEARKKPTASQRIIKDLRYVWTAILFIAFCFLIKGLLGGPISSFSSYLLSFVWQRGINVFSISTMLLVTLSLSFVLFLLRKLMSVIGHALNSSVETICQLLVSLLRYAVYITIIFVTLYMFGADTTGVLASLGAFSIIVGLGAKSLITDVLAGTSLIMEGDYRVGDIIDLNGFCGKVTDIGIRTTKVEDIEGNVKIFSNSSISGVINMTSKLSNVRLDVNVSSNHSFDEVEKFLKEFLAIIEEKYPQIMGHCMYMGVQASERTSNTYRLSIPCDEVDRAPLRRALNKELSEFCKERGIERV